LVADKKPLGKTYIPFGASFIVAAWADAAIRQSRRINFGSVFIVNLRHDSRLNSVDSDLFGRSMDANVHRRPALSS
jgi:hypothetical protein